jgi:Flp pilus assembly protein TadG
MAARPLINGYNTLSNQHGATLVEFAIVGLLFFTILFGMIEFGLLMFNQQVITNAGREGARLGIVARPDDYKVDKTAIEDEVRSYAENHIVSFGNKNFNVAASFESDLNYCEKFKDELTVSVTYDYSFLFLPFATKTLGTTAIMVCE